MPSNYWLKLYHEILNDTEFSSLEDRLWRRVIELSLMGVKHGTLPPIKSMAWILHCPEDELSADIAKLDELGYLFVRDDLELCVDDWQRKPAAVTQTRTCREYIVWRNAVKLRDLDVCQACGEWQGESHAHHILPWAEFPDHRFDVDNGLTLCAECYKQVHRETRAANGVG